MAGAPSDKTSPLDWRLTLRLPKGLYTYVAQESLDRRVSVNAVIIRALEDHYRIPSRKRRRLYRFTTGVTNGHD